MYEYEVFIMALIQRIQRLDNVDLINTLRTIDQNLKVNSGHPRTSDNKPTPKGDK